MKTYEVDKKEFFKGYSLIELIIFKKRLNLIENELSAGNLEKALSLTMDQPFIEIPEFNFYRINILIRLGHLELALDVAEDLKFKDFKPIQLQREGLIEAIKVQNEEESKRQQEPRRQEENRKKQNEIKKTRDNPVNTNSIFESSLSTQKILMTKLYVGVLTLDEINNADIPEFDKILLTICYYDKHNHAIGLKYIKSIKDCFTTDSEKKTINILRSRLESKRNNYFNIEYYKNYICSVSLEYASKLENEIKEREYQLKLEEERQIELIEQRNRKVKEELTIEKSLVADNGCSPQVIQSEDVSSTEVAIAHKLEEPKEIKVVKTKKSNKEKKTKEENADSSIITIKDAFPFEVEAIGSFVYVEANNQMTSNSIKAFDIFESIVNQDVNNISALKKFESLVIKFSRDKRIGVTYNKERFGRYLKKEQR